MEKIKRPIFKKWWFWLVVLIVVIGAISSLGGNKENTGNLTKNSVGEELSGDEVKAEQAKESSGVKDTNSKSKIEFTNVALKQSLGFTTVIGEANNKDSKAHSFTLKVSFYNKDKKLLGTAAGAVNDLNSGESKIFTAMATEDFSKADSHKVQVDTMVASTKNKEVPIEFSNIVIKDNLGLTTVEGECKNSDSSAHSFTIVVGLYDSSKKLIGTASGAINDIAAGDTMTFTAIGTEVINGAKSHKVQVDTLVK